MNEMTLPSRHRIRGRAHYVASELKDPICHSNECQIGSFSSEATTTSLVTDICNLIRVRKTRMPELCSNRSSNPRSPTVQAGGFNHCTSPPPPPPHTPLDAPLHNICHNFKMYIVRLGLKTSPYIIQKCNN